MELLGLEDFSPSLLDERQVTSMAPTLILNPAGGKMESPKVLNLPATPILIFFLTISLMFSVSSSEPYDYMAYVVQWQWQPPDFAVTIHGLWPSNYKGPHVRYCKQGRPFVRNEVLRIKADLDKCWPDIIRQNNYGFWSEQWERHGRCSLNELRSQYKYFNQAVTLCETYNEMIQDSLWRARFYRENIWWVNSWKLANEIENAIGKRPVLRCKENSDVREVILCFDVQGKDPQKCPPRSITTCPLDILL